MLAPRLSPSMRSSMRASTPIDALKKDGDRSPLFSMDLVTCAIVSGIESVNDSIFIPTSPSSSPVLTDWYASLSRMSVFTPHPTVNDGAYQALSGSTSRRARIRMVSLFIFFCLLLSNHFFSEKCQSFREDFSIFLGNPSLEGLCISEVCCEGADC